LSGTENPVKKMAELLKSGAAMLAETCPVKGCNLPLFKLKSGEVVCPVHGRVYLVKTDEEAKMIESEVGIRSTLDKLEQAVLKAINDKLSYREFDTSDLINYLEILERIYRIRSMIRKQPS